MFKYSIQLAWSDEDEGYIALIPELEGLSAFGETPEDAVREAKSVAESFIRIYKEDGTPVPKPKKVEHFSGKIRLRLPKNLHGSLAAEASNQGVSLNSYIISLLSSQQTAEKFIKQIKELEKTFQTYIVTFHSANQREQQSNPPTPASSERSNIIFFPPDKIFDGQNCERFNQ